LRRLHALWNRYAQVHRFTFCEPETATGPFDASESRIVKKKIHLLINHPICPTRLFGPLCLFPVAWPPAFSRRFAGFCLLTIPAEMLLFNSGNLLGSGPSAWLGLS